MRRSLGGENQAIIDTSYLHDMFLPLILDDFRPYDALVCASRAAQRAIEASLEAVAESIAERIGVRLRPPLQLPVIPYGVDVDVFRTSQREISRQTLGIPSARFVVLWVGRLSPLDKADLFPLLRAFARFLAISEDPQAHLYLVSAQLGPYAEDLRAAASTLGIAGHVEIDGRGTPTHAPLWMASADIFVSPADNIQETFGLTPLEAMASGVPQVVSDWSGYRDTVQHGITGFLLPTTQTARDNTVDLIASILGDEALPESILAASTAVDLDALTTALLQLWRSPHLRAEMGAASRRRAVEHYAWPRIVAQYDSLWSALVDQARRSRQSHCSRDIMPPAYRASYRGYSSDAMDPEAPMHITVEGREWLAGAQPIPRDRRWMPYFSAELAQLVLRTLEQSEVEDAALTLADLSEIEAVGTGYGSDWLSRHVLWLLKHGFVRLGITSEILNEGGLSS